MSRGTVRLALLAVWVASHPALIASQSRQTDSLPELALDDLPPRVRAGLARAYGEAQAHPRDPAAVERLAMLLHAYEQYSSADVCYRIARRLAPSSLGSAYLSGVVQAELGNSTAAVVSLREAVAIDRAYLPARVRLAETLMNAGDLAASRMEYEGLVHEFPELAIAHYGLGQVASALGDVKTAAKEYECAVAAAPQFGAAHYALALTYRDIGDRDRAHSHLEAYERFGRRRPMLPDRLLEQVRGLRSTARDLIAEGARLVSAGRLQDAIARHLKALEADPAAVQAHVNLIALYGRTDSPKEAEEHYHAALAQDPNLAEAHYNYGVLLAQLRRYPEAADAFLKTLDVDPFHAQAHNNLATLLLQQGRVEEAAAHYREALANDPQHRTARFNLGRALVMMGRPREAVEQLRRILVPEDADTPRFTYALATAYFAAGDTARAQQYGQAALRLARQWRQTELAARIEAELQKIRQ